MEQSMRSFRFKFDVRLLFAGVPFLPNARWWLYCLKHVNVIRMQLSMRKMEWNIHRIRTIEFIRRRHQPNHVNPIPCVCAQPIGIYTFLSVSSVRTMVSAILGMLVIIVYVLPCSQPTFDDAVSSQKCRLTDFVNISIKRDQNHFTTTSLKTRCFVKQ